MMKKESRQARIPRGPIVRTPTVQRQYDSYRRSVKVNDDCVFCNPQEMADPIRRGKFVIIKNRFQYAVWDGCKVLDHLMVVPNRHVGGLGELTAQEKTEYADLLAEYEALGYSFYSRAIQSATRSIIHLHTHLIKLDTKPVKGLFYLEKPHVLLYRK